MPKDAILETLTLTNQHMADNSYFDTSKAYKDPKCQTKKLHLLVDYYVFSVFQ